jgi:L-ascorbate metabolism protein UlaG (beta-lactamase superfamily)
MMEVRRLAWSGLEISARSHRIVIDLVEDFSGLHGKNAEEIPQPPVPASIDAGLLTHLHSDHADADALKRALRPDAPVFRPERETGTAAEVALVKKSESALDKSGLQMRMVKPWEAVEVGPFTVTALPAVDGFGDPQVSWSVATDGCRVLHAGDTLFHGWWWSAAIRCGPFDVVFLPVGGAVVELSSRRPPSPLPAGMDPHQAAVAAKLLGAGRVVPIHYGPLHETSNYAQVDDPPGTLAVAALEQGVDAQILAPGESLRLEAPGSD